MIEAINEALELLHIARDGMGPDRMWLDEDELTHFGRISRCIEGLEKLRQQEPEPVAWISADTLQRIRSSPRLNQVRWQTTLACTETFDKQIPLYAAPVPAAVPAALTQEPLRGDEPIGPQAARADYVRGWNACRNAMLSAAPAAPAVPDDVAKDAERTPTLPPPNDQWR